MLKNLYSPLTLDPLEGLFGIFTDDIDPDCDPEAVREPLSVREIAPDSLKTVPVHEIEALVSLLLVPPLILGELRIIEIHAF